MKSRKLSINVTIIKKLFLCLYLMSSAFSFACEYCASTSQICTGYTTQCDGYTQQCNSYGYECTAYDDQGNCLSYDTVCSSYSTVCISYSQICSSYESVCNSYYYGQYVTVRGQVTSSDNNQGLQGLPIRVSDFNSSESASSNTNGNGNYSSRIFSYDDNNGNNTIQSCVNGGLGYIPTSSCRTVTTADNCTEPTLTSNHVITPPVIGHLDGNGPAVFTGWALDPLLPSAALEIHFYIDGPAGQGSFAGATTANIPRADVNSQTNYSGNHGFSWTVPASVLAKPHLVYVYAVSLDNRYNPELGRGSVLGSLSGIAHAVIVGTDTGSESKIMAFNSSNSQLVFESSPYFTFPGGTRVAVGDVNGDGTKDLITAAGPGGGPHIKVYNGVNGTELFGFFAYAANFTGGIYIASGDVDGDGKADIITGADAGGGPHVKVFSGLDLHIIREFFAYSANFTGGVRVAAGDINGDGKADIITAPGPGGGPHIQVFSGLNNSVLQSFFAYNVGMGSGVYVGAGDVDGDGKADIITAPGKNSPSHTRSFSGVDVHVIKEFFAYDYALLSGVRVASTYVDGDAKAEIVTVPGANAGPHLKGFSGATGSLLLSFFAEAVSYTKGLFVSGY